MACRASWKEVRHDIRHVHSLASERISVPELRFGTSFVERYHFSEEPLGISWKDTYYDSFSPSVFALSDALVHSSAGIVSYEDLVVEETLEHTEPDRQRYTELDNEIVIAESVVEHLEGTYVSALAGGSANYFHALIDCVGKLSALPSQILGDGVGVLIPSDSPAVSATLQLINPELRLKPVAPSDTLRVEHLILPSSIKGQASYHPCLSVNFERLLPKLDKETRIDHKKRLYIDRRSARARRLVNEVDLIVALELLGFEIVCLEKLSILEQICLFRQAKFIVAPHGAGLSNLIYAGPDCMVLELFMDAYVNWSFRRLAALRGLRYDCIVGPALPYSGEAYNVHELFWLVSVQHVVSAIRLMLDI